MNWSKYTIYIIQWTLCQVRLHSTIKFSFEAPVFNRRSYIFSYYHYYFLRVVRGRKIYYEFMISQYDEGKKITKTFVAEINVHLALQQEKNEHISRLFADSEAKKLSLCTIKKLCGNDFINCRSNTHFSVPYFLYVSSHIKSTSSNKFVTRENYLSLAMP